MLKDPIENVGTGIKGAGKVDHKRVDHVLVYPEKASTGLSNALDLAGSLSGKPVMVRALGDDANIDIAIVPKGTGVIVSGQTQAAAVQGGAASCAEVPPKVVTAIADNTATTVLTITIPNGAHAALIELQLLASLGAGGAVGAFEESLVAYGQIVVVRTAGVAAVATAITLSNAGKNNVAGADSTATLAYSLAAVAGANSATQTIAIQVTIARGGGTSTNHQCLAIPTVINANASGVTVA